MKAVLNLAAACVATRAATMKSIIGPLLQVLNNPAAYPPFAVLDRQVRRTTQNPPGAQFRCMPCAWLNRTGIRCQMACSAGSSATGRTAGPIEVAAASSAIPRIVRHRTAGMILRSVPAMSMETTMLRNYQARRFSLGLMILTTICGCQTGRGSNCPNCNSGYAVAPSTVQPYQSQYDNSYDEQVPTPPPLPGVDDTPSGSKFPPAPETLEPLPAREGAKAPTEKPGLLKQAGLKLGIVKPS